MPKSKRAKVIHTSKVTKKDRAHKERLFENIRDCVTRYRHCFVFSVDNMRNTYLKDVRQELSDSRLFFGKTKLMARALGHTPSDSSAEGIHRLTPYLGGAVGLLFTDRAPAAVAAYLGAVSSADFARAGAVAPRKFTIPWGVVHATAGEVPPEHDVPLGHTLEPELRRLGVPTRMVKGKVVLEEPPPSTPPAPASATGEEGGKEQQQEEEEDRREGGYVVCREGDTLDSRQTRLLKLFDVCLAEFRVKVLAYWDAATSEVTELDSAEGMDGVEGGGGDASGDD